MVLAEVSGGLGNQMFQYACGKALAIRNSDRFSLDFSWYDRQDGRTFQLWRYNIDYEECDNAGLKSLRTAHKFRRWGERLLFGNRRIRENGTGYDDSVFRAKGNLYLQGFWQSEKYFRDCKRTIENEFCLVEELDVENRAWAEKIRQSRNAVSVHIRRGDYVTVPVNQEIFAEVSLNYYNDSLKIMGSLLGEMNVFVFSNDLPWAKANLVSDAPMFFVDVNDENNGHKDMHLMSLCGHNIIANSTFSWWGAWLNKNREKIVIAPRKWFKKEELNHDDIIPDEWIVLPS
ncbi:MAG: alpha-1,2-fucosyltransferase [Schwartzia sp.]|nr:alpha-1,2-fucosyltransferase [Schwartzia sp. (in: firmicutes)]